MAVGNATAMPQPGAREPVMEGLMFSTSVRNIQKPECSILSRTRASTSDLAASRETGGSQMHFTPIMSSNGGKG